MSIEERLQRRLTNFTIKERWMFIPRAKPILRGIAFEGSSFNRVSFYVTAFVIPLCIPTKHLYFNFGHRIRHQKGGDRWNSQKANLTDELAEAIELQALPFLSRVQSLPDFITEFASGGEDLRKLRAIAFSYARIGKVVEAIETLTKLSTRLDSRIEWQHDTAMEANMLKSALVANPPKAMHLLGKWENETIRNLTLENFV